MRNGASSARLAVAALSGSERGQVRALRHVRWPWLSAFSRGGRFGAENGCGSQGCRKRLLSTLHASMLWHAERLWLSALQKEARLSSHAPRQRFGHARTTRTSERKCGGSSTKRFAPRDGSGARKTDCAPKPRRVTAAWAARAASRPRRRGRGCGCGRSAAASSPRARAPRPRRRALRGARRPSYDAV